MILELAMSGGFVIIVYILYWCSSKHEIIAPRYEHPTPHAAPLDWYIILTHNFLSLSKHLHELNYFGLIIILYYPHSI